MQDEETMDLKQSNGVNEDDTYIPNSKSTDLIKPSKSGNLDNQKPSGECFLSRSSECLLQILSKQISLKWVFARRV